MCSANTGNVNTDIFVLSNGYLVCNYYGKVNNSGVFYPGICTTQITFTSPTQGQPINFNIACNVGGLNLGNSFFTLQMISSTACTTVV
jgi:transketolase N-terminal domain/subunit